MTQQVKILRHTGIQKQCANGYKRNLGSHQPNSKWGEMDYMFSTFCARNLTKTFNYADFQNAYTGLLMACGFELGYAKKMSALSHLKNGPEYAGFIQII